MNKKHIKIFTMCLVIIAVLIGTTIIQGTKIIKLENSIPTEEFVLEECPFCNGNVSLKPVNNRFYIECEKCHLCTDFFISKKELVKYWNNRN